MLSKSIGARILFVVGIAASLTLTGLVVFYTQSQRTVIVNDYKVVTGRIVSTVVAGLGAIMETGSAAIAQQYAEDIKGAVGLEGFSFIRPNGAEAFLDNATLKQVNSRLGQTLFRERTETREVRHYPENHQLLQQVKNTASLIGKVDESGERYTILLPIANKLVCHQCHGDSQKVLGFARLSTSLQQVNQMVSQSRNQAIWVLVVVLILFLLLTYLFLRKAVITPIHQVTEAMYHVEQGDLTQQVPEIGKDELGRMARSFNAMARQILEIQTGLEMEQDKLTTIILNAGEGIVVTDREERIALVNPAAEALLGKAKTAIIKQGFYNMVDDSAMIERLIRHPDPNYAESVQQGKRYLSIMAARIHTNQGDILGMAALMRDVTNQRRREAYLEAISYTDELTGLLNRRSLTDILDQAVSDALEKMRPLSLLMLDLDHFKRLNDTHGHDMGDRVLGMFGKLLKRRLRDSDYACRYGGEEFCVILTNTPAKGAFKTAEDIRRALTEMDTDGVSVTTSIGVASLDQLDSPTPENLLKAADMALYEAKDQGRNLTIRYTEQDTLTG
ncbi:sensor domain-containing diguanylate cyclase [Candidatus Thiodiazotropha sp. CDECU1]|uniref:sensor domain-containing diguanylate cyclase n=1 Tax=Candidatus Thiodiazotropha sp. CDECU1 TaxID=3065865 RepID=UPI002931F3A5|nr:diguanylate cyclase [Candidatus Thiodiazotropha sp. CDECU1]